MKQKLSLTQLSKAQMEDVVGGDTINLDSAIAMCDGCDGDLPLYAVLDIGQNCNCGSIFNFLGLNIVP